MLQVPICLAGTDTDEFLTAEPAVVVQSEIEEDEGDHSAAESLNFSAAASVATETPTSSILPYADKRRTQHGVTLRRAVNTLTARRKRTSSTGSEVLSSLIEDDELSRVSPFERSLSSRNVTGSMRTAWQGYSSGSARNLTKSLPPSQSSFRRRAMSEGKSNSAAAGLLRNGSWKSRDSDVMFEVKEDQNSSKKE